jgi:hypothetical protein
MNLSKLRIVLLPVLFFICILGNTQTELGGVTFKLYQKPDTNSTQIKLNGDNCSWKLVDSMNEHAHTYVTVLPEFNDTIIYSTKAYYGKVESSCGDIGYVHSSQLEVDGGGFFSFPNQYSSDLVKLVNLSPMNGCSDFEYLGGTFQDQSGKLVELPLNTYWGFYDTDENCESIKNTYIYNCTIKLFYKVMRYYDWVDNTGWTYYTHIEKTIITDEALRTVSGTNVNIRQGPGKTYGVIGKLNPGDMFCLKEISHDGADIDGYYGSWVKISFKGIEGWIYSKFIKRK